MKRFVGATARDCLRRVKEELGPEAVVISNKAVENGVEIVAMSPESLDAISRQVRPAAAPDVKRSAQEAARPAPVTADDYTVSLSSAQHELRHGRTSSPATESPVIRPWSPSAPVGAGSGKTGSDATGKAFLSMGRAGEAARLFSAASGPDTPGARVQTPDPFSCSPAGSTDPRQLAMSGPSSGGDISFQTEQLMAEMRVIKQLLERQLAGFAWGEMAREAPVRALLFGEMLSAGFSCSLTRRLVQEMPADLTLGDGRKWLMAAVNRRLRTLPMEADFIDRGGVYALVGPTGVGKTTTTAKLAARCVVRYGAQRLALLTTDGYRIGAHEQLRIYGRILGVPVFVVRDGEDLRRTLADLHDKHMVLIDTVGMSQRDRMVAEQVAMLTRSGEVNRLLLLNAGSRGDTLDEVVQAYGGEDLSGVVLTKVDEATALAPALDCVVRHGLTLGYVANGQRVPEDLHLPNRNYLVHRAFKVGAGDTPHSLKKEEVSLAMGQGLAMGASLV